MIEDPLTGDHPSRQLQEEEEEAAQSFAEIYASPPAVEWTSGAARSAAASPSLLVIAVGPLCCELLSRLAQGGEEAARLTLPEHADLPAAAGELRKARTAPVRWHAEGRVMSVSCSHHIPAERAVAWTTGLLQHCPAAAVRVLASLPAHELRGSLPPPSEDGSELTSMQFTIQTSAAGSSQPQAENGARPELQQLPSGVLIQGLPAALMSCCQARRIPAELLLDTQVYQPPDAAALARSAQAFAFFLKRGGWDLQVQDSTLKSAAAVATRAMSKLHEASPRSAVFV